MWTRITLKMVTETSITTNFQARFFYNAFLHWLPNLLIAMTFLYYVVRFLGRPKPIK